MAKDARRTRRRAGETSTPASRPDGRTFQRAQTLNSRPCIPPRVAKRRRPEDWKGDELLTLSEAAFLFWPEGPLTTTSLRTAVRDGMLDVVEIAGKLLTTPNAIRRMSACGTRARDASLTIRTDAPDVRRSSPTADADLERILAMGHG